MSGDVGDKAASELTANEQKEPQTHDTMNHIQMASLEVPIDNLIVTPAKDLDQEQNKFSFG